MSSAYYQLRRMYKINLEGIFLYTITLFFCKSLYTVIQFLPSVFLLLLLRNDIHFALFLGHTVATGCADTSSLRGTIPQGPLLLGIQLRNIEHPFRDGASTQLDHIGYGSQIRNILLSKQSYS